MKKSILLMLLLILTTALNASAPLSCVGNWLGVLKVSGMELRIVFKITTDQDGKWLAKLDSPDQGAKDIPVDNVEWVGAKLALTISAINGQYNGVMAADNNSINGEWKQGGMTLPLDLKRVDEAPQVRRPQNPVKPYPYNEVELVFENKAAGIQIAGTLIWPKATGPFPAVILISGSGPQERDETIFNHKPFWVLADHLCRNGIAVLRYDDRGIGRSKGNFQTATTQDFCSDALAALEFLKTRQEINPKQIGLIGHSEGGVVAPMAAAGQKEIAFIVLLAGTGHTGEEILYSQIAALARQAGAGEKEIQDKLALQKQLFAIIKAEPDNEKAAAKLKETLRAGMGIMSAEEKQQLQGQALDRQIQSMMSPWYRYFLTYDPRPALQKVTCPVLALNGEKDLQVPARENLKEIEKALKSGGNKNYIVKQIAGLNHLFQTCQTGGIDEYGKSEETMSPQVLNLISEWIVAVGR